MSSFSRPKTSLTISKHLKGQSGPCVSNEKGFVCLSVMKNEHFLKEPSVNNEKVFVCNHK